MHLRNRWQLVEAGINWPPVPTADRGLGHQALCPLPLQTGVSGTVSTGVTWCPRMKDSGRSNLHTLGSQAPACLPASSLAALASPHSPHVLLEAMGTLTSSGGKHSLSGA